MKKTITSLVVGLIINAYAVFGQLQKGDSIPQLFLPDIVTTGDWELNVAISPDQKLITVVKWPNPTIFYTEYHSGKWSPLQVAPFSGNYEDTGGSFSADGKTFYFSSNRPIDNIPREDSDLWSVKKTINGWSEPKHLGSVINHTASEIHPSVAENGNLYFVKDDEHGIGGYDIYLSKFENGAYQKPENLGSLINTQFNEENPFIAPDESYLLFMSQKPGGLGGCDLYISYHINGAWSTPENLTKKVNTSRCDFNPYVTAEHLVFMSFGTGALDGVTRKSYRDLSERYNQCGNGAGDIFFIPLNQLTLPLKPNEK